MYIELFKGKIKFGTPPNNEVQIPIEVTEQKAIEQPKKENTTPPPGRVSKPDDSTFGTFSSLNLQRKFVTPNYKVEIIPLLRDLYKVNPDIGIALQDMFKLANCGHEINFLYNTPEEASKMRKHLKEKSIEWGKYTYGIDGIITKWIIQAMVGGAISTEAAISDDMKTIENILFIKPESILFERDAKGGYHPYQKVNGFMEPIKLNENTYFYCSLFSDLDEPYGVPPFMPSLDPLDGQYLMKENFKNIMETAGMIGFLEAMVAKPQKKGSESDLAYENRLNNYLYETKARLIEGIKDGLVVGFMDDHEFKLNATNKNIGDIDRPWNMNQQSVANGLGISSNIIGVATANTEGGAGIMLSKLISQLRIIQTMVAHILTKIYSLELRLAGFNNKGISIDFHASTVADELKVQQGLEIKARVAVALYNQGIYSQQDVAILFGKEKPDVPEPRVPVDIGLENAAKKQQRKKDQDTSERTGRDKKKINPKRKDQNTKPV